MSPEPRKVWKPICERTVDELKQQAERFRQLAAAATTVDVRGALLELADQFQELANQRPG